MLRPSEPDPNGAKRERVLGLLRIIGITTDIEPREFPAPIHQLVECFELLSLLRGLVAVDGARNDLARRGRKLAGIHRSARSIDGKKIFGFLEHLFAD